MNPSYRRILNENRSWIKPHSRDRIFEKVENDIACKYPSSTLNGLSLVIAIFDYSTVDIIDFEGELWYDTANCTRTLRNTVTNPHHFWDPKSRKPSNHRQHPSSLAMDTSIGMQWQIWLHHQTSAVHKPIQPNNAARFTNRFQPHHLVSTDQQNRDC